MAGNRAEVLILIVLTGMSLRCANQGMSAETGYEPLIIFSGIMGGDEVTFRGNRFSPNTCRLIRDTLRMYFYSDDFDARERVWTGDQIRLDVYLPDSMRTIGQKEALLRLSRYTQTNQSYAITPADSNFDPPFTVRMKLVRINRRRNGAVRIEKLFARPRAIGSGGQAIEISQGVIRGKIGR